MNYPARSPSGFSQGARQPVATREPVHGNGRATTQPREKARCRQRKNPSPTLMAG